jgi:ribonucleoside-diphosphate reductase alpha chain
LIFSTELAESVFKSKYLLPGETHQDEAVERVVSVVQDYHPEHSDRISEFIHKKWLLPAGGIWRAARNPDKNVSVVNCTTLNQPDDNLESIFDSYYWWAKYAAFGQGEGIDLSKLRPRGAVVHNSSHSSTGAISFMSIYDAVLKVIAQQGRRGASLISLNIKHPDIPEFIYVKDKEGVLESANISIQMTDDFMEVCLDKDAEWTFFFQNKYETIEKKMKASEVFQMIAEHAWKSGDPGLQFIDTSKKYSNSDALGYPVVSTNACSEQWMDPHNLCLLSSVNVAPYGSEYYDPVLSDLYESGIYLLDAFRRYEYDEGRSPNQEQRQKLIDLPRIGLGITGLADRFIRQGVVYGSPDSIRDASYIFRSLAAVSYKVSYDIAKKDGHSFTYYDPIKYQNSAYVKMLLDEGAINPEWLNMQAHVCKTTVAPTGSLSLIAEVGGSGIEPIFSKYFVRRERSTSSEFKEWFTFNETVRNILEKDGIEVTKGNADKLSGPEWITAHNVDNRNKIALVSEIQKWVDSSISVTFNLHHNATVDDIKDIYYEAWKSGLKGVTVFRDGCKPGVLITEDNYNNMLKAESQENRFSPVRPKVVECDIYEKMVNKERHIILVGLVENKPYEIFVTNDPENKIDLQKHKKGFIVKASKGRYDLQVINGSEKTIVENIGKVFDKEYGTLGRFVSMSLRHKVPIPFIVDQLAKDTQFDSFEKAVSRTLKNYIEEGEKVLTSDVCPVCGSELIYQSGCKSCINKDCMWSKCD